MQDIDMLILCLCVRVCVCIYIIYAVQSYDTVVQKLRKSCSIASFCFSNSAQLRTLFTYKW